MISAFLRSAALLRAVFAPGASGHAERDPVQPGAKRLGLADRTGLTGKDEEHRLRRVPGLLPIAKDVETDPMNDRTMPLDESGEGGFGRLVRPGEELSQELLVRPDDDRATIPMASGSPPLLPLPRVPWVASLLGWCGLHFSAVQGGVPFQNSHGGSTVHSCGAAGRRARPGRRPSADRPCGEGARGLRQPHLARVLRKTGA